MNIPMRALVKAMTEIDSEVLPLVGKELFRASPYKEPQSYGKIYNIRVTDLKADATCDFIIHTEKEIVKVNSSDLFIKDFGYDFGWFVN